MHPVDVHAERRGKYVQHMGKHDSSSFPLPVPLQTVGSFALRNNMSINVYGVDDYNEVIYSLRVSSTLVPDRYVDLLLFERDGVHHYAIIRNFSRLVGRQLSNHGHTVHCCRRCIHAYTSQELLDAHVLDCCHAQRTKFPKDPRCRFTNIQKPLLAPFLVYADSESILQRSNDEAMDTIQGIAVGGDELTPAAGPFQEHLQCSFAYNLLSRIFFPYNYFSEKLLNCGNLAKTTAISRNLQQSTRNKLRKVNTEQQTNYKLKVKTIKLVLRE